MALILFLIFLGLVLLMAELILIPGVGIAGILGFASCTASIILGFKRYGTTTGLILLFSTIAACTLLVALLLRKKTWNRFALKQTIDEKALETPNNLGVTVGMEGVAHTRLRPSGTGRFGELNTEVQAEQGLIEPGTPIVVTRIDGLRVFVMPTQAAVPAGTPPQAPEATPVAAPEAPQV